MKKTPNKYSREVCDLALRMVLDGIEQYESRSAAIVLISSKIGCAPQTLNEWVRIGRDRYRPPCGGGVGLTQIACFSLFDQKHFLRPVIECPTVSNGNVRQQDRYECCCEGWQGRLLHWNPYLDG